MVPLRMPPDWNSPIPAWSSTFADAVEQVSLCIIRSGQDWSSTEGLQRREYLERMEPVLEAGMAFLRDRGQEVNCHAGRYMREIGRDGAGTDRSLGPAYFRTMADLEGWAETHPTHLAIFKTFLGIAPKYGANLQLRPWHEVSLLPAGNQFGEHANCAAGTGLLGGLASG
ncbi:phenylacetaldoxime dehydratase family protein [Algihabitans albus]|uniref:phenylacetaldoxime dehydratase family protein n=1 Tax=Algihabitans albus TaxID=2164067 RepID=UPI000E5D65EA|nr:phenylacetaldoxime dehydratase family protein [Algihabitans albus]